MDLPESRTLAGDKIVAVDGKPFVGKIVTNQEAMHRLKGPRIQGENRSYTIWKQEGSDLYRNPR